MIGKQNTVRRQKAVTLIELLISLFIGVVVIGALLGLVNYTSELQETSRNKMIALNDARQVIEQIKYAADTSFDNAISQYSAAANQTFTPAGLDARGRIILNNVAGGGGDLYDVMVLVCWRQRRNRIIGECVNSGGVLQFSDLDGDGNLESPCSLTTAIRRTN
ncbi:MAG: hypothetical protein A2Y00_07740 [Omnitrophica WOR_2 bacterium GWF2_43_52]|nr:MAG: hypothetical protein A2062_07060 [Omnitrophica WOR_2 bacterium GWA2_44_7]OGX16892.1 MAG: hypothetical protein A2Y01_00705 [Omnitrophica WOR_2 bacterium GWC2_44_8]OGX21336.1 MAG: hypothetical protein A2Y00_07740 [Omnitrophica WOR_2 bacterium GWF2_43_52]OGX56568.1 MAG: hypothetical protein A2460_03065 [Omnitrophica WOR_2 bacterium RIFOXYC2_FULL_43_9]